MKNALYYMVSIDLWLIHCSAFVCPEQISVPHLLHQSGLEMQRREPDKLQPSPGSLPEDQSHVQ